MLKDILDKVISGGKYDLQDMLDKLDTYHAEGKITGSDRQELAARAQETAPVQLDVAGEIRRLWDAVHALEEAASGDAEDPAEEWPPFEQPTGLHDAYTLGAKVTYRGRRCTSLRAFNMWSPSVNPLAWRDEGPADEVDAG